jgi:aspartate/methionine/tyrosine aminotransferase
LSVSVRLSRLASTFPVQPNPLYRERDQRLSQGLPVVDLVSANVTEQGIIFPPDLLHDILAEAAQRARTYRPDPLGQLQAREAVSVYYRDHQIHIPASQVVLTPGTSLAYWYAFSVFCDPGDEVLVPRPSYPLFDELANLARVRMVSYPLDEARRWAVNVNSLAAAITDRTRAIILISPHNPTGAVASAEEIDAIAGAAADHELPIIADEVFGEFLSGLDRLPRPAGTRAPLVVTLNGFSKMLALPGMKLGWMALSGETTAITRTLAALERISDAFLPVNEIVQAAVPRIFSDGRAFAGRYREEIAARRDESLGIITRSARASVIPPRGGFYAAVRVNTALDDEALALHILRTSGCMVHPGFFYDLDPTHIVLSVVSTPEAGRQALGRVVAAIDSAP